MNNRHVVIMCGGSGTRLWPLSTPRFPKPFLPIPFEQSLLEQAFIRAKALVPTTHIWVITTKELKAPTLEALKNLPNENVLLEPFGKNTAPALVFGMCEIKKRLGSDFSVLVLSADHYIPDIDSFKNCALLAFEKSEVSEALITFGIQAAEPKTDYGYIEAASSEFISPVKRFVEKPSLEKAKEYLAKGSFFWNSGMFCWRSELFFSQMKEYSPEVFLPLESSVLHEGEALEVVYKDLPSISIDYALMEKSKQVFMIRGNFAWSDLGTWDSVAQVVCQSGKANATSGLGKVVQGQGNLVYTQQPIVLFGVDNLVVVQTEEVTLVTSREKSSDLKKLFESLG